MLADRFSPFIAQPLGHIDLADRAIAQKLNRLFLVLGAAALHARLHDAFVLARRLHHLPALENVVAGRLLHEHIFARLTRPDRRQRMPVIAGGNGDGIDIFVVQQLAQIPVRTRRRTLLLFFGEGDGTFNLRVVDVAHRGHSRIRQLYEFGNVVASTSADAHDTYVNSPACTKHG